MFFAHNISLKICWLQHYKCVAKSPCELYCVVPFNFRVLQCKEAPYPERLGCGVICYTCMFHWITPLYFGHSPLGAPFSYSLYQVVLSKGFFLFCIFFLSDICSNIENVVILIFLYRESVMVDYCTLFVSLPTHCILKFTEPGQHHLIL